MNNTLKIAGAVLGLIAVAMLQQYAGAGPKPKNNGADTSSRSQSNGGSKSYSRDRAGDFDYYALVLSWSPTYCLGDGADRDEPQCSAQRPYAFVLHGLWPQYESGYPSECDIGRKPWVEPGTIAGMMDIMPSRKLIIHEYKKHGTCAGLDAAAYYSLARKLFTGITIPASMRDVQSEVVTSPGQITAEFLKANPKLKAANMAVDCSSRGKRLREVRFCFGKDGAPRSCGKNENPSRLCGSGTVVLPPVRG